LPPQSLRSLFPPHHLPQLPPPPPLSAICIHVRTSRNHLPPHPHLRH
jgi:hypothetical protein